MPNHERTNALTGQERMRLKEMERMLQINFDQTGDHPAVTIQLSQTDCEKSEADGYRTFLCRVSPVIELDGKALAKSIYLETHSEPHSDLER